jgi:single-strand DNA-binding protein
MARAAAASGGAMNKVMLAGRITKPVELKSLPSGSKVAVGSVATHDFRGGEERTEFHRLVFWEKLAEIAAAHLQTGSLVSIDGRLKTHEWESEGSRRWMTEVIVNRLEFLGPKPQSGDPVAQGSEPTDLGEAEYGEEIAPVRA